ncbi:MAG: M20/M25/M40 family metallo-hydrolase [Gemmatimonadaceae bacterium]|nr:M20/M25/M40 family metallo-hydrolase [Gemmatimonadaceae bacterium]
MSEGHRCLSASADTDSFVSHSLNEDADLTIAHRHEHLETSNVVARLAGSGSGRDDDVVLVMAHYDAFGRDESGRIRAGAADNAIGTAMLLAVADALAHGSRRPDRTVIFMATTGEEIGMLGAMHWADNPAVPLARIIATINIDGIGSEVLGPVTRVVGFGSDLSSLGTLFARATQDLGTAPRAGSIRRTAPVLSI